MIGARSDRNALAGAPVDRLRQAQRVVTRSSAIAKRHPGGARLAVQIDCSAVDRCQELAAELRMRRGTLLACTRTQRDMKPLLEWLLGSAGNQRTSAFNQDPLGADRDVASLDDHRAFDVQRAYIEVLVDDQRAATVDSYRFAASREVPTPRMRVRPADCIIGKVIGCGGFRCGACGKKFEKAHRPMTLTRKTKAL